MANAVFSLLKVSPDPVGAFGVGRLAGDGIYNAGALRGCELSRSNCVIRPERQIPICMANGTCRSRGEMRREYS
jgi:hypothetical protein